MPRPLRLVLPGVAMHIIQRGTNRAACFRQESDYLVYLSNLRELAEKHACAVHAYCLMTNHVHLLLTPGAARACACLMRVRAGMADRPAAYGWSSHAANSGMRGDPVVSPHAEYLALSAGDEARHAAYRGLFEREQEPWLLAAIRDATDGGYPLASDAFKAAVLAPLGARTGPGKRGPKTVPAASCAGEELRP